MKERPIIYQVFTRLFGANSSHCVANGNSTQNGVGKMADFTQKALEQIKDLGCTHIWYTGIIEHATQTDYTEFGIAKDHPAVVKGLAGSPYAIKDYYDINPDLATKVPLRMKEFEALVRRTHKAGLKMIIDFVPNHVSRQYGSDSKPAGVKDLGEGDNNKVDFDANNNSITSRGSSSLLSSHSTTPKAAPISRCQLRQPVTTVSMPIRKGTTGTRQSSSTMELTTPMDVHAISTLSPTHGPRCATSSSSGQEKA